MGETSIQWCHYTLNPWRGCTKATWTDTEGKTRLHPGCMNCYAEVDMSVKLHGIRWGKGQERVPKAESGWSEPLRWARAAAKAGERRRVFCASLADVLDDEVPDSMRERLWDTIRKTAFLDRTTRGLLPHKNSDGAYPVIPGAPGLDWLLLTKRPENWKKVPDDVRPLVWLGTSISDQATVDEWVPRLLAAQGFRYRFLSAEPLVGPVDLSRWLMPAGQAGHCLSIDGEWWHAPGTCPGATVNCSGRCCSPGVDWVIGGGESGRKARPFDMAWARSIVEQCREAGVACFVKQLGALPVMDRTLRNAKTGNTTMAAPLGLKDPKGGDWDEWPEDLRVRMFPGDWWER